MKVIYALLFTLLLLNSCTKNSDSNTYNFSGVVIDYSTGQRVGNAKVSVIFTDNIIDSSGSMDYSSSTITMQMVIMH